MTSYTVDWTSAAEDDLAAIWLASADRGGITAAAHRISGLLKASPLRVGRPRMSSVHRTATLKPLGIEFEVIEDDKRVIVLAVWDADRGRSDPTGH